MRSSLKKCKLWKYHGVRRRELNAENISDGIKITLAATVWHSHPTTTGFTALLRGLMQSKQIKVARWFKTGLIRGFPPLLKFWGQQVHHGTRHHAHLHWNQLPAKLQTMQSSVSLLQDTAKLERNSGNLEQNDDRLWHKRCSAAWRRTLACVYQHVRSGKSRR